MVELKNVFLKGDFMIKNLLLVVLALVTFSFAAEAQYGHQRPYPRPGNPRPYPNRPLPLPSYPSYPRYPSYPTYPTYPTYPSYPVPAYPVPYVYTCNAVGLVNGLIFYGIGNDTFTASQRALFVCQSSGQVCQITNCR